MPQFDVSLTLIGGPTVLLELGGLRILTDPTLDGPGSYQGRGVTLTKVSGPALEAADIGTVDLVLLSHDQHADNLDRAGRAFLETVGRVITTRSGAERLGVEGLDPWESVGVALPSGETLRVTATPARHGPEGIEPISGEVIGFALSFENHPGAIYLSGDTVWYDEVAALGDRFDIRLALLFAGSAEPRGAFHMTMDVNDTVAAAHAFPRATVVPVHCDGWAHFKESASDVAEAFAVLGLADRLRILEPGVAASMKI